MKVRLSTLFVLVVSLALFLADGPLFQGPFAVAASPQPADIRVPRFNNDFDGTGPGVSAASPDLTTLSTLAVLDIATSHGKAFLPLILAIYPPVPAVPVLNEIENSDGNADYVVSWRPAARASTYILQEGPDSSFAGAVEVYRGSLTSWTPGTKTPATYYYRVRAENGHGSSPWSEVNSVTVPPPTTNWLIRNSTGGNLTIEFQDIEGRREFPSGDHTWVVPSGTHTFTASAWCGSGNWTDEFPAYGEKADIFECRNGNQVLMR